MPAQNEARSVMSWRVFSRRIEYQCLANLFQCLDLEEMQFDIIPTERNGPLTEFLRDVAGHKPEPDLRLSREQFEAHSPSLFATISESMVA